MGESTTPCTILLAGLCCSDQRRCVCADALVSDERAEAARAQAAEEAEAAFQRECTFTPALDTVSKKLAELSQPRYTVVHTRRRATSAVAVVCFHLGVSLSPDCVAALGQPVGALL